MQTSSMAGGTLIVGTGALATLFACRLVAAGQRVTMLGTWRAGLEALRTRGARIVDERGIERAYPVQAVENPAECMGADQALVLVKSWQTEHAARLLAECLSADGLAVTLQNGLGNKEILERWLGADRAALGTATTGATLLGPGLVRAGGEGSLSLESHTRIAPLEAALRSGGFQVQIVTDARSLLWGKLVINCAINPLTAILGIPNGELLRRPAARALMRALADEAAAVARTEGAVLAFADPAGAAEEVARRTASNYSSMFQDVRRQAPTEIDAICGAVVRAARAHGIAAPLNDACWHLVQALVQPAEREIPLQEKHGQAAQ